MRRSVKPISARNELSGRTSLLRENGAEGRYRCDEHPCICPCCIGIVVPQSSVLCRNLVYRYSMRFPRSATGTEFLRCAVSGTFRYTERHQLERSDRLVQGLDHQHDMNEASPYELEDARFPG